MSINDEEIDLRLALGSRSYSAETRLNNSSSGAGVNANSRVDMPFAASDPLSELVWSPHKGLRIKCAKSSLADNKPFVTWDLGENAKDISTSMSIRSNGRGDTKVSDFAKLKVSLKMLDGGNSSSDFNAHQRNFNAGKMEENCKGDVGEVLGSSQNMILADIAESGKRNAEQDILAERNFNMAINWRIPSKLMRGTRFNRDGRLVTHASRSDIMGLAVATHSEHHHTAKVSEALVCSLPNLQSQHEPGEEVTSASGNVDKNIAKPSVSIHPPTLVRLESFAENDLVHLAADKPFSLGKRAPPREDIRDREREKGKEKASSDGDPYRKSSNDDEDDSHESVESCTSAGLLSKGIKRHHFDQGPLIGSKRMRKQIEGSYGSTSFVKSESSFMNWISNMVKGLSDSNKEEPFPLPLNFSRSTNHKESLMFDQTPDCTRPVKGFQTVFQSLYCQSTKASVSGVLKDNQSLAGSRELMVADEKSPENIPQFFGGNNGNLGKQIVLSNKGVHPFNTGNDRGKGEVTPADLCEKANSTADKTTLDVPLPMSYMPGKSSPLSSLWVTRFYARTSTLENCKQMTEKACDCSTHSPNANLDSRANDVLSIEQKLYNADSGGPRVHASAQEMQSFSPKMTPIQSSQKLTSSEAMVSIFAKRLDALRNIIQPSEKRKSPSCQLICFFCGGSGHDLWNCPDLTEIELENLLAKIISFERVEESPRLCIRCFQLDHWAISCPLASSSDQKQVVVDRVACIKKPVLNSFPTYLSWDVKESSRKRLSSSNEFQQSTSSSSEHRLKGKQVFPPCYYDSHYDFRQEEVFHAIRKLRLSRADILRWMSSNASISYLNGFFLRLRLGKVEGDLGGPTYYVACITDDTVENIDYQSKPSILVDVAGIKSPISSQYISNHDFLEDEMKAWWSRIVKVGGNIPSLDELNSKFKDRRRLGL